MSRKIIRHLSEADPVLAGVIAAAGPYRLRPEVDCPPFQALARAIAHQQLHASAAKAILTRLRDFHDGVFPTPESLLAMSDADMRAIGFSGSKTAALRDLAAKTIDGIVPDRQTLMALDDQEIIDRLTQVRGIGRWTVEMMLMFQLGRPDVLPIDDFGVRNGFRLAYGLRKMPTPRALAVFGERWRPFRSAASWYLWRAVDLQKAGTLPEPAVRIRLPRLNRARVRRVIRKVRSKLARK